MTVVWSVVLLGAVFAAHWGAEQLASPLKKLRRQWGFTAAAGGALVGLASAGPDVGINIASALTGVGNIGLGNMLGSNVISVPGMVVVAFLASRKRRLGEGDGGREHGSHVDEKLLALDSQAVTVQALPYLAVVVLAAILILLPPLRGLQPVDGVVMVLAYVVYLGQALLRGRGSGESVDWRGKEIWLAAGGVIVLAASSYAITTATARLAEAFGIADVVAGLFLVATMTAVPAWFATWAVARSGQVESAATTTLADNTVAITLGFAPLALVGLPVERPLLITVTFAFVAVMPALYAILTHFGGGGHGLRRAHGVAMAITYVGFVVAAATVLAW